MDKNRMKKRRVKEDGTYESKDDALLGIKLVKKDEWCKNKPNKAEKPSLYKNL